VGADRFVADELGGLAAVEVDQVREIDRLRRGVTADLAGLRLHRVEHTLVVIEQPVAQLAQPAVATLVPQRLPLGLIGTHPGDRLGDPLG
jgi:ribosomal protein L30/L7E